MKVLVTGANGFLATNIIRELNSRQIKVRGLVRKRSKLISSEVAKYEKFIGDLSNYNDVRSAALGCDVIIHAAANTSQTFSDELLNDNVDGTSNVIGVCEELDIERLIFVSSANTFGYGNYNDPGDETREMHTNFKNSVYASSKLKAQEAVLKANNEGRIKALVVNPSFLVGKYDSKPSSGKLITTYLNGRVALCPPGGKSFIHAKYAANAICNAITMGKNGQCYLLTGENLSYRQFYNKLSLVTGIERYTFSVPAFILQILGLIGSVVNMLGIQIPLNHVNAKILSIKNYYSNKKAITELKMPVTSMNDAIKDAVTWFVENKHTKAC